MSRTQLRVSFGGAVGLDYNAVWLVARTMGTEIDEWTLLMLRALEGDMLQAQAAEMSKMEKDGRDEER